MENGFSFELYGMIFENCFIHSSNYTNGNLKLSLFGTDPKIHETAHFADITLEQNQKKLKQNEIIVDCKYKPNLIPQLLDLGILQSQVGIYILNSTIYPIYTIDLNKIAQKQYYMQAIAA